MSSPKPHQGFLQLSPFLPPPLQTAFHLLSLIVLSCLSFSPGGADSLSCGQVRVTDACAMSSARGGLRASPGAPSRAETIQARIQPGTDQPEASLPPPEVLLDNRCRSGEPRQPQPTHRRRLLLEVRRKRSAEHLLENWRGKAAGGFGLGAGVLQSLEVAGGADL